jgi:hypothetical protein
VDLLESAWHSLGGVVTCFATLIRGSACSRRLEIDRIYSLAAQGEFLLITLCDMKKF